MKRFITVLLSVLLALVMCFAVISCGDDTPAVDDPNGPGVNDPDDNNDPNGDPEPTPSVSEEVIRQAVAGIGKLYASDSYRANVAYGTNSKNSEETTGAFELDKRGNMIRVSESDDNSYIVDMYTGYMYSGNAVDGYVAMPILPADTIGYFSYAIERYIEQAAGEITPPADTDAPNVDEISKPDVTAAYDEQTKTLTVTVDAAEQINGTLDPLYDAYKKNKTIRTLLDDYVKSVTDDNYTFSMIFDSLLLLATTNSEATFDQANAMIQAVAPEIDFYELLGEVIELTDELRETIAARTVGEIISGTYDYITNIIDNPPTDAEQLQSVAYGLVAAAFINETEYTPEKINEIKAAVNVLLSTTVRAGLSIILADRPEALAFISSGVTFNAFKSELSLTFDDDGNIGNMTVSAEVEHSYTGDAADFKFLSDNEYKFDLEIALSDYADSHEEFDGDVTAVANNGMLYALIYGDIENAVTVYVETAGENLAEVQSVRYYSFSDDDEPVVMHDADNDVVSIDVASSTVSVNAAFINEVLTEADGARTVISVTLTDGINISLTYVDETDMQDVVKLIISNFVNVA